MPKGLNQSVLLIFWPSRNDFGKQCYFLANTLVPNERMMYSSIIKGTASACFQPSNNTDNPIKVNFSLLSDQPKFLNLSANKSSGATNSKENRMLITARLVVEEVMKLKGVSKNTSPVINRAFAGVGSPIKESV